MGSKILRVANPLMKSPQSEARDGFETISEAVNEDSANVIIHALRATAAAESAEHLKELFEVAAQELTWLESRAAKEDSVLQFVVNLNWAKYHYKLAWKQNVTEALKRASERIDLARTYACTPVYAGWAAEWEKRIADLPRK
jgi:hypothetical protein